MTRKLLLAAAGLALLMPAALAYSALAQGPPAPAGASPPVSGQPLGGPPVATTPPGPGRMADMPPPSPPPPRGGPGGPPPPPPPSHDAHIRLERGDARVDVKCAEGDTTQACATVAEAMLDKLAAMPARN